MRYNLGYCVGTTSWIWSKNGMAAESEKKKTKRNEKPKRTHFGDLWDASTAFRFYSSSSSSVLEKNLDTKELKSQWWLAVQLLSTSKRDVRDDDPQTRVPYVRRGTHFAAHCPLEIQPIILSSVSPLSSRNREHAKSVHSFCCGWPPFDRPINHLRPAGWEGAG